MDKEYKKYVHANYFYVNFGITEEQMIKHANDGSIRYRKMIHSTRLYHIDDGPILKKIHELDKIANLTIFERCNIARYVCNIAPKKKICYSRVQNKSGTHLLIKEKKHFEKYIKNAEIIQEYGEVDDLSRPEFLKILKRCQLGEIKSIYITSTYSVANKMFKLVESIFDSTEVTIYILTKFGFIMDLYNKHIEWSNKIKSIESMEDIGKLDNEIDKLKFI
jgi:hypothetical protein